MLFEVFIAFLSIIFWITTIIGCGLVPHNDEHISEALLSQISSRLDYETVIENTLEKTASNYKPEAVEKIRRFLLASEDIAKGNESILISQLDYPIDKPKAKPAKNTDEVVIVIDAGFSDVALTYADDVLAYYEMGADGRLNEKSLDLVLPRWAWYLYELQANAGNPFRILRELKKNVPKFSFPSFNLINNTSFETLIYRYNPDISSYGGIIYDRQSPGESAYHGAKVVYTLKEWAPSAKLILVRYDLSNDSKINELQMLTDLDGIARKFNAGYLVRSSSGCHHWHGVVEEDLLRNLLIINAGQDSPVFSNTFLPIKNLSKNRSLIMANTFSTGCSRLKISPDGSSYSAMKRYFPKIAQYSFRDEVLTQSMLDASTVFIDRHTCLNRYNPETIFDHIECIKKQPLYGIGFKDPENIQRACSVEPYLLVGDSSSAAPLVAAWAIYLKNSSNLGQNRDSISRIANYINGFREPNQTEPYIFQDPITYDQFPIFEEGYGNGLIIPKKFSDY